MYHLHMALKQSDNSRTPHSPTHPPKPTPSSVPVSTVRAHLGVLLLPWPAAHFLVDVAVVAEAGHRAPPRCRLAPAAPEANVGFPSARQRRTPSMMGIQRGKRPSADRTLALDGQLGQAISVASALSRMCTTTLSIVQRSLRG